MRNTLVAIPARMQSTRLPGKPLADIHGEPMIVHVWRRAMSAEVGRVIVATDSEDVISAVRAAGGEAILTRADHPSGSDRIFEAVNKIDPDAEIDNIVNLQGDLPTLEPHLVKACLAPLQTKSVQIATLAAEIRRESEKTNPNVVKVVGSAVNVKDGQPVSSDAPAKRFRALYFTRATAPWGDGPLFHHIGIYAYRRAALERFVGLRPSPLEQRERLEQLRALEDGMRIDVAVVETVPLGVDTPEDLGRSQATAESGLVRRLIAIAGCLRELQGLPDNLRVGGVIGEDQHEPRIELRAGLGAQAAMRFDKHPVGPIGIRKPCCSHKVSHRAAPSARLRAAMTAAAVGARKRAATCPSGRTRYAVPG